MTNTPNQPVDDDLLQFAAEDGPTAESSQPPWKLLIVDDDDEVHHVTKLALSGMRVAERNLRLLQAHSGAEAVRLMRAHDDVAVILMDVVMETDHAGLDAIKEIRETLGNSFVRIILRTGQPGQAPERDVITRYDINDYKEKTELTANKLFTSIYTGICAYRDLLALDTARYDLQRVLTAAASLFELQPRHNFYQGALQQLTGLLQLPDACTLVRLQQGQEEAMVVAATGRLAGAAGRPAARVLGDGVAERIARTLETGASHNGPDHYAGYFSASDTDACVLYMPLETPLSTAHKTLADNFCRHLAAVVNNFAQLA